MNTYRLEAIKKYPETVLKTIFRGVVFCCANCNNEVDKNSIAALGTSWHRQSFVRDFDKTVKDLPHCPHCHYGLSHDYVKWANKSTEHAVRFDPIPLRKYNKYEHVLKYRKTWYGRRVIDDSVVEYNSVPNK